VRPESKANALLAQFEQQSRVAAFKDPWAQTLKDIVELGPDAVPDLMAELDATNNDMMLRALGFTLRAIGDKRAVPALIRAIPRTLRRPGSDMGCKADDMALLTFMQAHDLNEEDDRDGMYGFGRPVREIGGALQALTGEKQGEDELNFVMLGGGLQQQLAQRRLYYRCAERWTKWWEANWKLHVDDEQYAKVDLAPGDDPPAIDFPHGAGQFQLGSAMSGCIVESDTAPTGRCVLMDFDTGRMVPFPEHLRKLADICRGPGDRPVRRGRTGRPDQARPSGQRPAHALRREITAVRSPAGSRLSVRHARRSLRRSADRRGSP
jgi:hypothetical protein